MTPQGSAASAAHVDRWEAHLVGNYGTPRLLIERGEGPWVTTADGRRLLDLLGGLAVNALGHCHPAVVAAVQEQASRLAHVSNLYATEPVLRLAARLSALMDGRRALFSNSGAEANEAALKLVRRHAHETDRPDGVIISFEGSFHGRTMGTVTLTGQPAHQKDFDPLLPNVVHVPYNDVDALAATFDQHDVVGVFAEFVQGEGGVVPMTEAFAKRLGALTAAQDALLVADEVQTGMGRTGRLFAYEHVGLQPDIVTLAKALGGGYPIGVTMVRPSLVPLLGPGSHGTTFGGNPVSCAAANAVLDVLERDDLVRRSARLGDAMTRRFTDDLADLGIQPRGRGLLVGLPLPRPVAPDIVKAVEDAGMLIGQAGKSVVRLAPPFIIEDELLDEAVGTVAGSIRSALS